MPGNTAPLYDEDFVRWTEEQAAALRDAAQLGTNLQIDSLGRSLRHELRSRLMVILEHLLKLEYSSAIDPRIGWRETINRERLIIEDLLQESPSLRSALGAAIDQAKPRALRLAAGSLSDHGETTAIRLPNYTEDQILGDWFPGQAPHPTPLPAGGERE